MWSGSFSRQSCRVTPLMARVRQIRDRPRAMHGHLRSVTAVLPHWSHGDRRLPDGRLTRPLPPPAESHGREAWCERRNGTAGGRWEPRLPGQPASSLDPHALVRTALASSKADRRGLWARHAASHPHAEAPRSRVHTMRSTASDARFRTWCHQAELVSGVTAASAGVGDRRTAQ